MPKTKTSYYYPNGKQICTYRNQPCKWCGGKGTKVHAAFSVGSTREKVKKCTHCGGKGRIRVWGPLIR